MEEDDAEEGADSPVAADFFERWLAGEVCGFPTSDDEGDADDDWFDDDDGVCPAPVPASALALALAAAPASASASAFAPAPAPSPASAPATTRSVQGTERAAPSRRCAEWGDRLRDCLRAERDVIREEVVDGSVSEAAQREQESLRKACRASLRRSRCARREAEWARRTEAAAERNEQIVRRVLLPVVPRTLLRDASPERASIGRRARGGLHRSRRLGEFLNARAAHAVDRDPPPTRAARAAAVAAVPDAAWWTVGDAALRAACVLVALGACLPQDGCSGVAMTRQVAAAR